MHSISVYLVRQKDIRDEKIESITKDSKTLSNIKFTEMAEGILATPNIPNFKEFAKGKMIAHIETDYFGGFGEQVGKLYDNGKKIYHKSDVSDISEQPINHVLKKLGVIRKSGMDEFDTIGLGKFRKNKDFNG